MTILTGGNREGNWCPVVDALELSRLLYYYEVLCCSVVP